MLVELAAGGVGHLLDDEPVVAPALVGERGVGRGEVDRLDVGRAQGDRRVRGQPRCLARDARGDSGVDDLLRTALHRHGHVDVGGVDRLLGGLDHVDRAVLGATLVVDLRAVGKLEGVAVEGVEEADVVEQPRGEGERLEGRARLAPGEGPVALVLDVVPAAVHRLEGSGTGLDRGEADLHALGGLLRPFLADRRRCGALHLAGEGGGHAQAAAVDVGVAEACLAQLAPDESEHMALGSAEAVLHLDLLEPREAGCGLLAALSVQHTHVDHATDDVLVAILQVLLGLLALRGVHPVGPVQDRRQCCSLAHVEISGVLAEVGLRRGLDAVGAAAEVDGVQVALEDLLLGLLIVDLEAEEGLLDLPLERALLREVEDLDVLLGDRRRTLGRLARRVAEGGAQDALGVQASVLPEGAVLRGDHRVLHVLGHLRERDAGPVLRGEAAELGLAVVVVDEGGLRLEVLVGVRNVGRGVDVGEAECADDDGGQPGHESPRQDPAAEALLLDRGPLLGAAVAGRAAVAARGRALALSTQEFLSGTGEDVRTAIERVRGTRRERGTVRPGSPGRAVYQPLDISVR